MEKYKVRSRWVNMLSRCEDEDNPQYKNYGGRGIKVCDEWHEFNNFYYWCINNNIQRGLQLDRINNDGNYEPKNCRFVTRFENVRNKSTNRNITAFNKTRCLKDWQQESECVVSWTTLQRRLDLGWNIEEALTTVDRIRHYKANRTAKYFEAFGESKSLKEWTLDKRCKVSINTLCGRIKMGWPVENALTKSPKGHLKLYRAFNEEKTLSDWFKDSRCQVKYGTLWQRVNKGMNLEKALTMV